MSNIAHQINLNRITKSQKAHILSGISLYETIQKGAPANSVTFRNAFVDFYFVPKTIIKHFHAVSDFFNEMVTLKPTDPEVFMLYLNGKGILDRKEFSICTKAVHTFNTSMPIYDSHVEDYLKHIYSISKLKKGLSSAYKSYYGNLCSWYADPANAKMFSSWEAWFKKEFASHGYTTSISTVKIIDFIVYAASFVKKDHAEWLAEDLGVASPKSSYLRKLVENVFDPVYLTDDEALVIITKYAFDRPKCKKVRIDNQVAKELGITVANVTSLYSSALMKLQS